MNLTDTEDVRFIFLAHKWSLVALGQRPPPPQPHGDRLVPDQGRRGTTGPWASVTQLNRWAPWRQLVAPDDGETLWLWPSGTHALPESVSNTADHNEDFHITPYYHMVSHELLERGNSAPAPLLPFAFETWH